jgi:GGDEF domain-containing protein
MALTNLKRYLYDQDPEVARIVSLVFTGVAASAVRSDDEEYAELRRDLAGIEVDLSEDFTVEHTAAAMAAAMRTLERYNQRTTRFIRQRAIEFQNMIKMLAQAVVRIGGPSELSSQVLAEIQRNLQQVSGLDDLQNIRANLGVCLEQVCQESLRQKEEARSAIAELQGHLAGAGTGPEVQRVIDPVTKLPAREAAQVALREACEGPGRKYVGVLVLDRLKSINSRFGTAVGDQVLGELTRHIELHLSTTDSLFRWSGPTLLTILRRQSSIDRIRAEVKPVFSKGIEKEFNVGGRDVFIPISPAWEVFPMTPPLSSVLKLVDAFVAGQNSKEYV